MQDRCQSIPFLAADAARIGSCRCSPLLAPNLSARTSQNAGTQQDVRRRRAGGSAVSSALKRLADRRRQPQAGGAKQGVSRAPSTARPPSRGVVQQRRPLQRVENDGSNLPQFRGNVCAATRRAAGRADSGNTAAQPAASAGQLSAPSATAHLRPLAPATHLRPATTVGQDPHTADFSTAHASLQPAAPANAQMSIKAYAEQLRGGAQEFGEPADAAWWPAQPARALHSDQDRAAATKSSRTHLEADITLEGGAPERSMRKSATLQSERFALHEPPSLGQSVARHGGASDGRAGPRVASLLLSNVGAHVPLQSLSAAGRHMPPPVEQPAAWERAATRVSPLSTELPAGGCTHSSQQADGGPSKLATPTVRDCAVGTDVGVDPSWQRAAAAWHDGRMGIGCRHLSDSRQALASSSTATCMVQVADSPPPQPPELAHATPSQVSHTLPSQCLQIPQLFDSTCSNASDKLGHVFTRLSGL